MFYRTVVLNYESPKPNLDLDVKVDCYGEKMRAALLESQPRQESYVSYAGEQETVEVMYG